MALIGGRRTNCVFTATDASTAAGPCSCHLSRRSILAGLAAAAGGVLTAKAQPAPAKRVDVHAHLAPPAYIAELTPKGLVTPPLANWSIGRHIEEMDQAAITTSILSITTPGVWLGDVTQGRRLARETNDYAAKLVAENPGRIGMFVAVPLPDIEGSLREIAYGLDVLKADGVGLLTSYDDKWLGDPAFDPIFEELNRRKAVVYTHPLEARCCRNLLPDVQPQDIEFGTDTTRAIAHWVFSGSAHRFSDLKIIWSHAGGTMPFLIERFDFRESLPPFKGHMARPFREQIKDFFYDTAQVSNPVAMTALKQLVPTSQIVFGTDYPYRGMREHVRSLAATKVFSTEELRMIDAENIARLLPKYRA